MPPPDPPRPSNDPHAPPASAPDRAPRDPDGGARVDEALFVRFRESGDLRALGELFERTAPAVLRVALHLTRDAAAAEDLVQETFVRAIEARADWDAARPLLPWLCGILQNRARHARWQTGRAPDPARLAPPRTPDPAATAAQAEFDAAVDAAIAALPEVYRPVLRLHLAYGQPPAAIAHALDRPPATVRSQLARGLEQLRRVLPAGLAGTAAIGLASERGLAAVRHAVLAHAASAAVPVLAAMGTTLGGALTMQKTTMAIAASVLAAGLWLAWPRPDTAPPPDPPPPAAAPAAIGTLPAAPRDAGAEVAPDGPDARRPVEAAPASTRGALRIVCQWADDGTPARDVVLQVQPALPRDRGLTRRTTRTGADGSAVVTELPAGRTFLAADRGGTVHGVVAPGTTTEVVLTIPEGLLVRGRVVDERGAPVPDAQVWLSEHARDYCNGALVGGVDRDGRFVLRAVEPDRLVSATAPGRRTAAAQPVPGARGEIVDVELVLKGPGATLRGRVVDPAGAPVAGARVLVGTCGTGLGWNKQLFGEHRPPVALTTDHVGAFAAHGLVAGTRQHVWVRSAGHCLWYAHVELAADRDTNLAVLLQRGATLTGHVRTAAGEPVVGAGVTYRSSAWARAAGNPGNWHAPDWTHHDAVTGADGAYHIDGITPGTLELSASTSELEVRGELVVADGEAARWDPVLTRSELRGRVVDENGAPLAGVEVTATPPRGTGNLGVATTDADGRFVCHRRAPVPHVLRFLAANDTVRAQPLVTLFGVSPGPDEVVVRVPASAMPTATLTGRLVASDGKPLANARVRCAAEGVRQQPDTTTDAAGTFRIGPLPAGTWRLQGQVGDAPEARRTAWSDPVTVARGEVRDVGPLALPEPGALAITATGPDGAPLRGSVAIEESTGWSETAWLAGALVDGAVRVAGLAPGDCRVKVITSDASIYVPATVVAGATTPVVARVPKGVAVRLVLTSPTDPVPIHLHFDWLHDGARLHRYDNWWEAAGERTWDERLLPGTYEIAITSETGKRDRASFTIGADDPPGRRIPVRLP